MDAILCTGSHLKLSSHIISLTELEASISRQTDLDDVDPLIVLGCLHRVEHEVTSTQERL